MPLNTESGAGVKLANPPIFSPSGSPSLISMAPTSSTTDTSRLASALNSLREFSQQLFKVLSTYKIGIIRELPIFDPDGAKVGWIGYNPPNVGILAPGLLLGAAPSQTANFTVSPNYSFHPIDATGGAVTVTLPLIANSHGRILIFIKTDATANAMTLDGSGSETINGSATQATTTQYGVFRLIGGSTEWHLF